MKEDVDAGDSEMEESEVDVDLRPRWEREDEMEESTLAAMMKSFHLNSDFFDKIFGPYSDKVLRKILGFLDFQDIISCCQTSEIWKAKVMEFHSSDLRMELEFDRKKAHHDWLKEDATLHEVALPGIDTGGYSVKELLWDDEGDCLLLLLESHYDANSPNFLDDPIEYVVAAWGGVGANKKGKVLHRVRHVDVIVKSICANARHVFLRHAQPHSCRITFTCKADKRRRAEEDVSASGPASPSSSAVTFVCETREGEKELSVDEFHAIDDNLYVWSKEGRAIKFRIKNEEVVEALEEVKTGEAYKCTFHRGNMLVASKHEVTLWDLDSFESRWRKPLAELVASIALSGSRAVIECLGSEFQKTSVLMCNLENGKLFKGVALSTNEVLRTVVSGHYVFVNFRNSRLTCKLVAFDLRTGSKVLDLAEVGELLSVNVFHENLVVVSFGTLRAHDGYIELAAIRVGASQIPETRILHKVFFENYQSKMYQKVLNHQRTFFPSPKGFIKDAHYVELTYFDYVKPVDFTQYLHDHEGCSFHGKSSTHVLGSKVEMDC